MIGYKSNCYAQLISKILIIAGTVEILVKIVLSESKTLVFDSLKMPLKMGLFCGSMSVKTRVKIKVA
jgi:hypothetical protein